MLTLEAIDREIANVLAHGTDRSDIAHLANLFVCRENLRENAAPPVQMETITADGSEFAICVNGRCFSDILPLLDELMATLQTLQPRLYDAFIRKLKS